MRNFLNVFATSLLTLFYRSNLCPRFFFFVVVFLGCTSTGRVGLCFLWFYVQELSKAQPAVVLVLKRLRRRGNGLKSHPTDGNRTCDPWFIRHRFIPYTTAASFGPDSCVFVAVFLGCTSTGRVGVLFLWFYVQELPKAQPAVVLV